MPLPSSVSHPASAVPNAPDVPIDSHLLKVFCLLVTERSVSRVAHRLHLTQPAVSATLRRLRDLLGDPLLVREKSGMVPTERALTLLAHAQAALAEMGHFAREPQGFDPATSSRTFRIGAPDYLAPVFMARVVEQLRQQAPQAHLEVHALGPEFDLEKALAEGELDAVIGNWPEPPERMHLSLLLEDEVVCLMSARHECAQRPMTVEDFCRWPHVVPMPYAISQRGIIDRTLASQRIERQSCVMVQSFSMAPYMLPQTDLVFTTTRHVAEFYAKMLNLAIVASPVAFPLMRFYLLWHPRLQPDPAHRFMRQLLVQTGRSLPAAAPVVSAQRPTD